MFGIEDDSVFADFEEQELQSPCPRKQVDGRTIYLSRELKKPKQWGAPVLCDFGSAVVVNDGEEHREDVQPDIYRAPEVILEAPWTYGIDIWNAGSMVSNTASTGHTLTEPSNLSLQDLGHLRGRAPVYGPGSRTQRVPEPRSSS